MLTRGGICVPPTVTYLPYRVFGSTLTAVGRSQLLARWPGTHSRILSRIQRAAQTVLVVYLKRTCSRVTSASSALGVLNDYALYKSTPALTHSLTAVETHSPCPRLYIAAAVGITQLSAVRFEPLSTHHLIQVDGVHIPNDISIGSAAFVGLTIVSSRHTDRQTHTQTTEHL